MSRKKRQLIIKNGAVLIWDLSKQGRSLVMMDELKRLYPNAKTEHIEKALEVFKTCKFDDDENKSDTFGKVLAAVIIDEMIKGWVS